MTWEQEMVAAATPGDGWRIKIRWRRWRRRPLRWRPLVRPALRETL